MSDETTQPTEEVTASEPKEEKKDGSTSSPQGKKSTSKGVEKLVEEIKGLKLTEVAELVSALEDEFGVSAAMPMMAMAGAPAAGGDAAPAEEKTAFNVELTASGDNKIGVIKAVREVMPDLGLKEAKDLVDGAPKMIKEGVKKEDAEAMKAKIEEAGGKVTLK